MINIIEFYPIRSEDGSILGNLRIEIVEMGIELLGVVAVKRKNNWRFLMPGRKTTDPRTGKEVRYPYINLKDNAKKAAIMDDLLKKAPAFIESKLAADKKPDVKLPQHKVFVTPPKRQLQYYRKPYK